MMITSIVKMTIPVRMVTSRIMEEMPQQLCVEFESKLLMRVVKIKFYLGVERCFADSHSSESQRYGRIGWELRFLNWRRTRSGGLLVGLIAIR